MRRPPPGTSGRTACGRAMPSALTANHCATCSPTSSPPALARVPSPAAVEHAAGVLCWRRTREGLQVLLVHRPRYDDWSWPKGKVQDDEPLAVTAVREAAEETGLDVVLGRPLGDVRYRLPDG